MAPSLATRVWPCYRVGCPLPHSAAMMVPDMPPQWSHLREATATLWCCSTSCSTSWPWSTAPFGDWWPPCGGPILKCSLLRKPPALLG